MHHGIAIRCGSCRGRGWLGGWFQRCRWCRGQGWFDAVTAPDGLGPLVAASDFVRTGAARALLVRPALPWERFPVPAELQQNEGGPDEATWERAVRASAVILYDLDGKAQKLAGGLELARLPEHHAAIRSLAWSQLADGALWRCVDGELNECQLRFVFFRAWRGDWLEVTLDRVAPAAAPRSSITGDAQKYVTGKLFVGAPKEDE